MHNYVVLLLERTDDRVEYGEYVYSEARAESLGLFVYVLRTLENVARARIRRSEYIPMCTYTNILPFPQQSRTDVSCFTSATSSVP